MHEETETLKRTYGHNGRLAGWSGQLIVVGLALDIVVLLLFASGKSWLETASGIFATIVIAAGVWLEIYFAHKSDAAAFTLQQLSDQRVAEAEARSAEANAKAAEAQLALEKFKAPRALSREAQHRILEKLAQFPKMTFDLTVNPGPEPQSFMSQIGTLLKSAGWTWKPRMGKGGLAIATPDVPQIAIHTGIVGFVAEIDSSHVNDWMPVLLAFQDALNAEGIDTRINIAIDEYDADFDTIHLFVGSKQ